MANASNVAAFCLDNMYKTGKMVVDDSSISGFELQRELVNRNPSILAEVKQDSIGEIVYLDGGASKIYCGGYAHSDIAKGFFRIDHRVTDGYTAAPKNGKGNKKGSGSNNLLLLLILIAILVILFIMLT